jgi:hypothetical protein
MLFMKKISQKLCLLTKLPDMIKTIKMKNMHFFALICT